MDENINNILVQFVSQFESISVERRKLYWRIPTDTLFEFLKQYSSLSVPDEILKKMLGK